MRRPKPKLVKQVLKAVKAAEPLDPPMTKKERQIARQFTAGMSGIVAAFQFADDPGLRAMAIEEQQIQAESINRLVQAYRDAK